MQGSPYKLLVVDDIADNRDILSRYFGARGFQVVEADCGSTALSMIKKERFDAVFLDILMPEIDGIEVLKRIRTTHRGLPVIMVSALSAQRDIKIALELGADDYVTKPVDLAGALTKLQRAIGRQIKLAEHFNGIRASGENHRTRKEMRRKPRRQLKCTAWIVVDKLVPPIECKIADLSALGACAVLQKNHDLPERFILLLSENGRAWQDCRLVWRTGLKVGLEFSEGLTGNERPKVGAFVDCLR